MGGFILRSKTEDLDLWEQRIKERAKSGMSVSEWCKVNQVSKNMNKIARLDKGKSAFFSHSDPNIVELFAESEE